MPPGVGAAAALLQRLQVLIEVKDKISKGLEGIRGRLQRFGRSVRGVMSSIGRWARRAGRMLLIALGGAVTGVITNFAQFETAIRNIWTLLSVGEDQIRGLSNSILQMSKVIPQTPQELGASAYDIVSAGVTKLSDTLLVLEYSAKAATAGLTTTKDASRGAISVMNAFGRTAKDIPDIFDLMFSTVRYGVITFSQLTNSIGKMATQFAAAKVPMEEMFGAFAFMTRMGLNAFRASTALRQAIVQIIKQKNKFEGFASVFDEFGKFRGINVIIGDMVKNFEKMTDERRLAKMRELVPNIRAQQAIVAMVNNYSQLSKMIDLVSKRHGAMEAAFKKQMDALQMRWKLLTNTIRVLMIQIGSKLAPSLKRFIDGITAALNEIDMEIVIDLMKETADVAASVIAAITDNLAKSPQLILAALGALMVGAFQLVKGLIKVMLRVNAALWTPSFEILAWVGDKIVYNFKAKLANPLIDAWNLLAKFMAPKMRQFMTPFIAAFFLAKSKILDAWNTLASPLSNGMTNLAKKWNTLAEVTNKLLDSNIPKLDDTYDLTVDNADAVDNWTDAMSRAKETADGVEIPQVERMDAGDAPAKFEAVWSAAVQGMGVQFSEAAKEFSEMIDEISTTMTDLGGVAASEAIPQELRDRMDELGKKWDNVKGRMQAAADQAKKTGKELIDASKLEGGKESLGFWERVDVVINRLRKRVAALRESFKALPESAQFVMNALLKLFQVSSDIFMAPFKELMSGIQDLFMKQLVPSFDDMWNALQEGTLDEFMSDFINGAVAFWESIAANIDILVDAIIGIIPDLMRAIIKAIPEIFQAFARAIPDLVSLFIQYVPQIMWAFASGLVKVLGDFIAEIFSFGLAHTETFDERPTAPPAPNITTDGTGGISTGGGAAATTSGGGTAMSTGGDVFITEVHISGVLPSNDVVLYDDLAEKINRAQARRARRT